LEKAVALDPGFAMAHARIGYAYAVTWNFAEKARPHFEKAFRLSERLNEKDKLNITGWYAIANLDYETAIGVFRKMIAEYPMEIEAYFRLGRLLQGEERFEEALEITRQGLILDPEAKELYNLRGGLYLALKRYDEAIAAYQSYIAFAPDEPNALDSLGLGYQATGRYQEAADAYRRALLLKPDFEVAVIHLGNLYFQQGRYREAIEQYQKYIQTTAEASERARGYESIAYVYLRGKNTAKAVAAANRAVELEKSAVRSSLVIALERGQVDLAESLRRKVFNQGQYTYRGARPPKREHHFYEGLIAIKRGQSDDAVKAFKEALIYQPLIWSVDSYEDCLGRAYLDLGQVDQAIAEFERVLKENPQYPLAHYHLAQAYERKGEREQGRQLYEQFLQVWKDADHYVPEVVIARQRLSGS
jgi:tetratricopeptide (TPR) repeat protein